MPAGRAVIEAGSCVAAITMRYVDAEEQVACGAAHYADVIALIEWPHMEELISAEGVRSVWDELSGNYGPKGLAHDYDEWAWPSCSDAFRDLIGWSDIRVGGQTASELGLLPGGNYTVVAAVADAESFLDGDHRVRCVASWNDPIRYVDGDITVADLLTADVPPRTRDCYLADEEGYLDPVLCDRPHTDQTMVIFDAGAAFGTEFIRRTADLDRDVYLDSDGFCIDAITASFGGWEDDVYYPWSTSFASDDWAVLGDREPDPDGYYPFGCLLSTYDGTSTTDLLPMTGNTDA